MIHKPSTPYFYKTADKLVAVLSSTRVSVVNIHTFGKGHGFEFRIYKSPSVVARYSSAQANISYEQWVSALQEILGSYVLDVQSLLPRELLMLSATGKNKLLGDMDKKQLEDFAK